MNVKVMHFVGIVYKLPNFLSTKDGTYVLRCFPIDRIWKFLSSDAATGGVAESWGRQDQVLSCCGLNLEEESYLISFSDSQIKAIMPSTALAIDAGVAR